LRRVADYENYLKRLGAIPRLLEQQQAQMRSGMQSGWMPPRAAILRVPDMFTVFAGADVTATPLWRPFAQFPDDIGADDRKRLTEAARRVLAEQVHPAFAEYKRFLESTYLPAARASAASNCCGPFIVETGIHPSSSAPNGRSR
jgi:uncharacterized protein (DUF885 family)